jgi:hypothetical protein
MKTLPRVATEMALHVLADNLTRVMKIIGPGRLRPKPRNGIEARLSAQPAVAASLLCGRAGLAEFTDATTTDQTIQALRR